MGDFFRIFHPPVDSEPKKRKRLQANRERERTRLRPYSGFTEQAQTTLGISEPSKLSSVAVKKWSKIGLGFLGYFGHQF